MKPIASVLFVAGFAGLAGAAQAQAGFYRAVTAPNAASGGVASLAMLAGREYQGSDEARLRLLPGIDYQWRNGFFAGTGNGIGFNASSRPDLAYGARITVDFGRKERRSAALRGMGDVDPRPELGAFLMLSPWRGLTLNSSVRYGSGKDRDGLLVDVGASWSMALAPGLRLGASVAGSWANARQLADYFGVDAAQSALSGYGRYEPDAGWRDLRAGVSLLYRLTPEWTVSGSITQSALQGEAKRSPIVRESRTTSALLALGYSF